MGFDYTPLYYDPEKEKLDAKFGAAKSGGMEGMKSRIKSAFVPNLQAPDPATGPRPANRISGLL